jgi:hypothetical protein
MTYAQYQEHFERAAEAEGRRYDAMPVATIIAEIRAGRFGECYQIWYSLAKRAKPEETNDVLLSFLDSEAEYLHRYHCAAALIQINKLSAWEPHHLSAEATQPVAMNLRKLREQLAGV